MRMVIMITKVNLEDIILEIECASETMIPFLDLETGETLYIDDLMQSIEENDRIAERIDSEPERYIRILKKNDINEYYIMLDFIKHLPSKETRSRLFNAVEGKCAFRRFKNEIRFLNIEQQWYDFHDKEFKNIAVNWCNEHNLKYSL